MRRWKRIVREGDRHSGHCESKPRTSDPKAAPAVVIRSQLHLTLVVYMLTSTFPCVSSDAFEHNFRCRFGMIHIELHVDFQMSLDIFQFYFEIFRPLGCIIPGVSVLHFKSYVCAKACRGSTCGVRTTGCDPLDIHGYADGEQTTTIWCHIGHLPCQFSCSLVPLFSGQHSV